MPLLRDVHRDHIVDQFRYWFEQHGACMWSVSQVSKETGIPEAELYNGDDFTGLLMDLCNDGVLCRSGADFSLVLPW